MRRRNKDKEKEEEQDKGMKGSCVIGEKETTRRRKRRNKTG